MSNKGATKIEWTTTRIENAKKLSHSLYNVTIKVFSRVISHMQIGDVITVREIEECLKLPAKKSRRIYDVLCVARRINLLSRLSRGRYMKTNTLGFGTREENMQTLEGRVFWYLCKNGTRSRGVSTAELREFCVKSKNRDNRRIYDVLHVLSALQLIAPYTKTQYMAKKDYTTGNKRRYKYKFVLYKIHPNLLECWQKQYA